ncbi:hypothetical protein GCM10010967_15000 [Dyadobacter beijingensis]|uniref:Bacteriocin-type signal sequence-containing protein n=1 Tax=Dyadobacter beijingensis TaxID=365489 RepID=A0ABQ2HLR9_9BACT|nr:hypothetical protein [Dyadobacter beijingensis]GGM84177.1 hypothetical protein GCM10010967_15000 [Dyadobacter beijingensis]
MKDENLNQSGNPEEDKDKIIEVAKERLSELDDEQLEKLSGGSVDVEDGSWVGCSCDRHSCN